MTDEGAKVLATAIEKLATALAATTSVGLGGIHVNQHGMPQQMPMPSPFSHSFTWGSSGTWGPICGPNTTGSIGSAQ